GRGIFIAEGVEVGFCEFAAGGVERRRNKKRETPPWGALLPATAIRAENELAGLAEADGSLQVNRYKLRYTALGHGHAVEAIHASHGDGIMRDDHEPRISRF